MADFLLDTSPVDQAVQRRNAKKATFNAYLGAFVAGSFQTRVDTDPSLTYVRYANGTVATAKHRNRINLDSGNQKIAIELGKERGKLSILDFDHDQAGAILEDDPSAGIALPNTGVTPGNYTNTDLTVDAKGRIITAANGSGSSISALFVATANVTIQNTTSELTLFGTGLGSLTLPVNWLKPGRVIEIQINGALWSLVDTNIDIRLYLGGVAIQPINNPPITNLEQNPFIIRASITCRDDSDPTNTTIIAHVEIYYTTNDAPGTNIHYMSQGTETTVDKTVPLALDLTWDFTVADASNIIQSNEGIVTFIDAAI